jgi:hypothetical protein
MYNLTCTAEKALHIFGVGTEYHTITHFEESTEKECRYSRLTNYTIYEAQVKDQCRKSQLVKYHD